MDNINANFDGLRSLMNNMNYERPIMNVPEFKDRKTIVLEKIEENTDDIYNSSKNQFWKNLLTSVIGGAIGGIISYLLTLYK